MADEERRFKLAYMAIMMKKKVMMKDKNSSDKAKDDISKILLWWTDIEAHWNYIEPMAVMTILILMTDITIDN